MLERSLLLNKWVPEFPKIGHRLLVLMVKPSSPKRLLGVRIPHDLQNGVLSVMGAHVSVKRED
jgi:hypothetical protein